MVKKELIEKAREHGIFMSFEKLGQQGEEYAYNFDRDKRRNSLLGIELVEKTLIAVKNSDGFIEIANRKTGEFLGIIYYYKKWKKFVWEQDDGVIMADNCMQELATLMRNLYGDELQKC